MTTTEKTKAEKTEKTRPIHIREGTYKLLKDHAAKNAVSLADAADALVATGQRRQAALARYRKSKK